jgi:hypothetical protein
MPTSDSEPGSGDIANMSASCKQSESLSAETGENPENPEDAEEKKPFGIPSFSSILLYLVNVGSALGLAKEVFL